MLPSILLFVLPFFIFIPNNVELIMHQNGLVEFDPLQYPQELPVFEVLVFDNSLIGAQDLSDRVISSKSLLGGFARLLLGVIHWLRRVIWLLQGSI